jgi:hypothetical protein
MSDSLIQRLRELPTAEPDVVRAEHIRKRCHTHLVRRTPISGTRSTGRRMVLVWQSLLAVLGFVYLADVIRFALALYGLA